MSFTSGLQKLRSALAPRPAQHPQGRRGALRATTHRPKLEVLEDRSLLSFTPAASFPAGTNPHAVATADFNNDGRLDIATANSGDNTVSVLLGNADGTFQPAQTSATGAGPLSVAVGDFNKDGKLDLATANAANVSVLLGNGDGAFQAPNHIDLAAPTSVAVGDFNGDGTLDLGVTSNVYSDSGWGYFDIGEATVLLGTGDGSFSAPMTSWLDYGYHTSGVVADFDGDGKQDLAVTNSDYSEVRVWLGDGQGSFSRGNGGATGGYSGSVAAGDVNGDGKPDAVTANYDGSVSVLLGDGVGGFATSQNFAAGSGPTSVVLADFDGDARLDIATANSADDTVSILRGYGNGAFSAAENFAAGPGASAVAAGDFSGDGWLDVATANAGGSSASVLINDQSWPSLPPSLPPPVSVSDATVTEGNTGTVNATFTLTLAYASDVDVTVRYNTADLSAAAGSDYTASSGVVTIPAGQTSATFTVAVRGDRLAEPAETFAVNLGSASNATITDGQGVGTILDDEPRISISDVTRYEGKKGQTTLFTFTVTLSAAYDEAVTVSFGTGNGTAATGDKDYVAKTGTLTFAPGETTKTITIEVKGDNKREASEYFYLDLFGLSSNALFTKKRGTGTILNDD